MREITRASLIDDTDKLLFDILAELKKLNNASCYAETITETVDNTSNATSIIDMKPISLCKLCGKDHSNVGFAMACARKQKKVGVNK